MWVTIRIGEILFMLGEPDWVKTTLLIQRYFQRRVHDCVVEDLTQITLEKAVRYRHKLRETQSQRAWLYRIASNTLIDYFRKQINTIDKTTVFNEEEYHVETFTRNEVADCVHCMIGSLDKHDKQLLKKIDLDSYSQKQLAGEQGQSYSSLKSQVQRARKKLKSNLLNCCEVVYDKYGWPIEIVKENKC